MNRDVATDKDTSAALTKAADNNTLQQQVQAEAAITQQFGQNASKLVGDYATLQQRVLEAKGKAAAASGIQATAQQYAQDAAKWSEGGEYRIAAHAAVGALGAGIQGAAGAAASAAASPEVAKAIDSLGLPEPVRQVVLAGAGAVAGAITGGTAGSATGLNQTVNNYLKHQEIGLKKQELAACEDEACRKAVEQKWLEVSQARNTAMTSGCIDGGNEQCRKNIDELKLDMAALLESKSGSGVKARAPFESNNLEQAVAQYWSNLEVLARRGEAGVDSSMVTPDQLATAGYLTRSEATALQQLRGGQWLNVLGAFALPSGARPSVRSADAREPVSATTNGLHEPSIASVNAGFKAAAPQIEELSRAAAAVDRGGLTVAGRALQKHGSREGSLFPPAQGNPASINEQGRAVVDAILNNPGSTVSTRSLPRYGEVLEVRAPSGEGIRFTSDGKFIGLLEPSR